MCNRHGKFKKGTTLYIVASQAGTTGSDGSSTHRTSYNGRDKSHGGLVWYAYFSGGGGGGYYGGGYGRDDYRTGGGGSGWIGGVSNGSMQNGVRSGNGYAQISYIE